MLGSAVLLVLVAVISALAGWTGMAIGAACLGQVCFGIFLASEMSEPLRRPSPRDHARLLPAR
ncbi:hypothetical protein SAMN05444156_2134 [Verrucomicrobium sp. GAS474]|uniref:hypothetical protein n=1 Tax=Verrucomicrobium sp. GAS474 TaxID=1882831 RepID=UPI00087BDD66|nr:hypothetical protein [Verrucomicrobium sp. GAS474]SDU13004.1 hypothetical protein SAMN05444156_2134 [Verrucomicrobium sp. GAS474]